MYFVHCWLFHLQTFEYQLPCIFHFIWFCFLFLALHVLGYCCSGLVEDWINRIQVIDCCLSCITLHCELQCKWSQRLIALFKIVLIACLLVYPLLGRWQAGFYRCSGSWKARCSEVICTQPTSSRGRELIHFQYCHLFWQMVNWIHWSNKVYSWDIYYLPSYLNFYY